jgi:MFS family permease
VLQRLGFPVIGPHRRFVVAIAIDAVGSGVFIPVSILYFLHTTPLSITHIGLALSLAAALQLPLGPLMGSIVDRVGSKRVLLAANLLEAVGFIGYVFAGSFGWVLLAASFVQLGQTAFWSSYSPVVAAISEPGERERWFGFLGALRNASFAVGGLAAAVAITIGTSGAYTAVVLINTASYLAAFVLILSVAGGAPSRVHAQGAGSAQGWRHVVRDRGYLVLVVTNYTYATSAMALNIAIPVYLTRSLGLPGWVAGAAFTVNTVLIGVGQGLVVNAMEGAVRSSVVTVGCALYGVSYVVLWSADWVPVAVGVLVALVGAVVYTGGELVAGPVLSALSTDAAPLHLRGRYVSLYQLSWTMSSAVAPLALTWLLQQGPEVLWPALIAVSVTGMAVSRILGRVMPQAASRVPRTRVSAVAPAPVESPIITPSDRVG